MSQAESNHPLPIVLITGGTDGLGRAAGLMLAEHGYRVFAAGRNAEKRAALEEHARERELPVETVEMDVCEDASVERGVAEIERSAGPVDMLVNCAGIAIVATMEEISLEDLRKQFETNFFGAVRVTQRVLPAMRERRRGRIINVSSIAGKVSNPLFGPYSSSKHALEGMSDALRMELRLFGIPVVLIEPGFIPTNMGKASIALSSQYTQNAPQSPYSFAYLSFLQSWRRTTARGRAHATPEDFARVILRAAREPRPQARYTVTRNARITVLFRRLFSDRMLDRMTLRMLNMDQRPEAIPARAEIQAQLEKMLHREPR